MLLAGDWGLVDVGLVWPSFKSWCLRRATLKFRCQHLWLHYRRFR